MHIFIVFIAGHNLGFLGGAPADPMCMCDAMGTKMTASYENDE
jgi:hypothetical protein